MPAKDISTGLVVYGDRRNSKRTVLCHGLIGCPDSKVHEANIGPTGPRWAPCWPHELCNLVGFHSLRDNPNWYYFSEFFIYISVYKFSMLKHCCRGLRRRISYHFNVLLMHLNALFMESILILCASFIPEWFIYAIVSWASIGIWKISPVYRHWIEITLHGLHLFNDSLYEARQNSVKCY